VPSPGYSVAKILDQIRLFFYAWIEEKAKMYSTRSSHLSFGRSLTRPEAVAGEERFVEIASAADGPLSLKEARAWLRLLDRRPELQFGLILDRRFCGSGWTEEEASEWQQSVEPLRRTGRLVALIAEFPLEFRFNSTSREALIRLRRAFRRFPTAAEFRHESWLSDAAVTTLIKCRMGFVNLEQPPLFEAMPAANVITAGPALVRFHTELAPLQFRAWESRIQRLSRSAPAVFVISAGTGADLPVNWLVRANIASQLHLSAA
jgi:hypothetical protein